MVSRSPDSYSDDSSPKSKPSLPETPARLHTVMVPVFISVTLPAEDSLQAECLAVEAVRGAGDLVRSGATLKFASVISPVCQ